MSEEGFEILITDKIRKLHTLRTNLLYVENERIELAFVEFLKFLSIIGDELKFIFYNNRNNYKFSVLYQGKLIIFNPATRAQNWVEYLEFKIESHARGFRNESDWWDAKELGIKTWIEFDAFKHGIKKPISKKKN